MHTEIEERSCDLAAFILENKATVRAAAAKFGISKSTVHKDLTERLRRVDPGLYAQVRQLLDWNKAQRHIRGGLATRRKYKGEEEPRRGPVIAAVPLDATAAAESQADRRGDLWSPDTMRPPHG